jgi:hypothetical protein
MGTKRLSRLTAVDIMTLHGLMKDYVVRGDKVNGVQYADYIAGWDDERMASLAAESMGRPVTHVQVRNLRQSLFGLMRKKLPPQQPKLIPEPALTEQLVEARMKRLEATIEATIAELKDYQRDTRHALWAKYNELLAHVRALDAEWSTCRPASYKPGLPEIINDTKGTSDEPF